MSTDSASNGEAASDRLARLPHPDAGTPVRRNEETVEALTVALGQLRRGAAALKAENHELRAEIETLRRGATGRRGPEGGRLAEVELPTGPGAAGAARMVIDHCLGGLVAPRTLADARLLASELVTNSVCHGDLDSDTILLRVDLTAQTVRLEIENPGTAGVIASRSADREHGRGGFGLELVDLLTTRWGVSRDQSTNVWLEMGRA
jgi:anti-sigma regulatory factor (Ser/Thr protein kinase)